MSCAIQQRSIGRASARCMVGALLLAFVCVSSGCNILGFAGAMIENNRRHSTKVIQAEYTELKAKNWAVVVVADRSIQAELPDLVPWMTGKICDRLTKEQPKIVAAGMVPAERILRYQYDHPSWVSMPRGELAKALTVDRLIVVEIIEYRLNDPGNQYLWSGLAAGNVSVIESESPMPDEPAFEKAVRVRFPDDDNYGQNDFDRPTIATALGGRFLDRVTWLFYTHDEPYYPKY